MTSKTPVAGGPTGRSEGSQTGLGEKVRHQVEGELVI